MKTISVGVSVTVGLMAAAMLFWVGCEESTTDSGIEVSPRSISVTNNHVITFTASLEITNQTSVLYHPLTWSLSNPALGTIIQSTGNTAIYTTTPGSAGPNAITVRDQAGLEGSAAISQSVE